MAWNDGFPPFTRRRRRDGAAPEGEVRTFRGIKPGWHEAGPAHRDAQAEDGRHHRGDRRHLRMAASYGPRSDRGRAREETRPERGVGKGRGPRTRLPHHRLTNLLLVRNRRSSPGGGSNP